MLEDVTLQEGPECGEKPISCKLLKLLHMKDMVDGVLLRWDFSLARLL